MALPWAHPPAVISESPRLGLLEGDQSELGLPLQEVSLAIQDEVQVRWELEDEGDDGNPQRTVVWWGAKIVGPAPADSAGHSSAQGPAFELLYEPRDDIPEEKAVVAFLKEEHVLRALDQEGTPLMWWRKKGDTWEEPPEEEGSEEEAEEAEGEEGEEGLVHRLAEAGIRPGADGHFGMRDVLGVVAADGPEEADPMAGLNPFQQRVVADGFRALLDSMEEYSRDATRDADGKVVVSADDVHAMFARAREKRQRRE